MRKKEAKNLDLTFQLLSKGKIPNFLELMSAIEDIGAIVQDIDSEPCELRTDEKRGRCPECQPS